MIKKFLESGWFDAAGYAAFGVIFLVLDPYWRDTPSCLMAVGLLLLAAVQAWLCWRRRGKVSASLLFGPVFGMIACAHLYRGHLRGDGSEFFSGGCFLMIAAAYCWRTVKTLKEERADP